MERLTKAEEQVMQVLWRLGPSFVKDVTAAMPKPKPALTTVSTIVRILEEKGFVGHEAFGRSHRYFARVTKEVYGSRSMKRLLQDYFSGSPGNLLSFFIEREDLNAQELDELLRLIKQRKQHE
ncbi:MAG: BlaI/MecI/CopY family transcriptional regulator [Flavobacteriales bacterium]|nr:BlaI/MecI/CopY family transcriptional regulator [Flavobacteriales bacterium]